MFIWHSAARDMASFGHSINRSFSRERLFAPWLGGSTDFDRLSARSRAHAAAAGSRSNTGARSGRKSRRQPRAVRAQATQSSARHTRRCATASSRSSASGTANSWHGDELTTAVASACACKTILWFRRALRLFPGARFLAKAEDDSALHDARIVVELRLASLRYGPSAAIWYGLMQWAAIDPASAQTPAPPSQASPVDGRRSRPCTHHPSQLALATGPSSRPYQR